MQKARTSEIDDDTAMMLVDQLSLHKNTNYTEAEKEDIFKDALFISANKAPVAEYNLLHYQNNAQKNAL